MNNRDEPMTPAVRAMTLIAGFMYYGTIVGGVVLVGVLFIAATRLETSFNEASMKVSFVPE